jgi:hypothetical protein
MLILLFASIYYGQATPENGRIPWSLTVVVMDGTNARSRAELPVWEAVRFIERRSRFAFDVKFVVDNTRHGYTPYYYGRDRNRDGKGDDVRYVMMGWDVPAAVTDPLRVSSSYLFLYKLNRRPPAQAGSAIGLEFGIMKGGKRRPYATIPTDQPWFVNEPNHGFRSWAAQIVAHEVINTIQAKIEAAPYLCGQLKGKPGSRADRHEGERLRGITSSCYERLAGNND